MFQFSKQSIEKLDSCDPRLKQLAMKVIEQRDCACVWGHRGEKDQNSAFMAGKSDKKFPGSKHNSSPSMAMDLLPCINGRVSWNDLQCYEFSGYVMRVAFELGIPIKSGADWDLDHDVTDQRLNDPCHFEISE
jgi:peptidoglycan L-alanyl-D-glutamate endopeptidase CwlK